MKLLRPERAAELKAAGITHIAAICKSHYSSRYYKVESIDDILQNNGRMPHWSKYNGYVHGIRENHINWHHTAHWSDI